MIQRPPCLVHSLHCAELQHLAVAEKPCFGHWPGPLASPLALPAEQCKSSVKASHLTDLSSLPCAYMWKVQSPAHLSMPTGHKLASSGINISHLLSMGLRNRCGQQGVQRRGPGVCRAALAVLQCALAKPDWGWPGICGPPVGHIGHGRAWPARSSLCCTAAAAASALHIV